MTTVNIKRLRDVADHLREELNDLDPDPSFDNDDLAKQLIADIDNLEAAADMLDPDVDNPDARLVPTPDPELLAGSASPDLSVKLFWHYKDTEFRVSSLKTSSEFFDELLENIEKFKTMGYRDTRSSR